VIRAPHQLEGIGPDVPGHRVQSGLGIRACEASQGPSDAGASGDGREADDPHEAEEPPPSRVRRSIRSRPHPSSDEERDDEPEEAGEDSGDQPPLERGDEGNDRYDEGQKEEKWDL
jgi:hypothetical protein